MTQYAESAAWWEHPEHEEFINELLDNAPDRFDGDEAAEEIVVRYVRALEQAVRDLARWAKQQGADLSLFAFEGEDDPDWQSWMLAYELTRFDGSGAS